MSAESALTEFASEEWNVYRTRFLIRAKQLTQAFSFTDALGREHKGVAGDYLVQSAEGMFRIAPREIFEDIYVRMEEAENTSRGWGLDPSSARLSA
jgi:hypothetical protein